MWPVLPQWPLPLGRGTSRSREARDTVDGGDVARSQEARDPVDGLRETSRGREARDPVDEPRVTSRGRKAREPVVAVRCRAARASSTPADAFGAHRDNSWETRSREARVGVAPRDEKATVEETVTEIGLMGLLRNEAALARLSMACGLNAWPALAALCRGAPRAERRRKQRDEPEEKTEDSAVKWWNLLSDEHRRFVETMDTSQRIFLLERMEEVLRARSQDARGNGEREA